jgi:hypothetical protein
MSVQGQPAVIVTATTQTPKAMIPAEIKNENTVFMIAVITSLSNRSDTADLRRRAGATDELIAIRRSDLAVASSR